jgi:hypothetical protein
MHVSAEYMRCVHVVNALTIVLDIQLIQEAEHFIYIGAGYTISSYVSKKLTFMGLKRTSSCECEVIFRFTHTLNWMHSISNTTDSGPIKNQIAGALAQRIIRAGKESRKFKVRDV